MIFSEEAVASRTRPTDYQKITCDSPGRNKVSRFRVTKSRGRTRL